MSRITPPFDETGARAIVQGAEDKWNRRVIAAIPEDYTADTRWRYRDAFLEGRAAIVPFLEERWPIQQHYRLKKELWAFGAARISVRFISEWQHRDTGEWFRTHGNEHWAFAADGLQSLLDVSANDVPIAAADRTL